MNRASFAYAQARIQARHGMRPQEAVWRRLASSGDLANYLQAARHTPLHPWIEGFQNAETSHALELHLRQQFRRYVEDVARWMPSNWRNSINWIRHLPDLPAVQYLLETETAPVWLQDDPCLRDLVRSDNAAIVEALRATDRTYLVDAWHQGIPLYAAWFEQWQRLWPATRHLHDGLAALDKLIKHYIHAEQTATSPTDDQRHHRLATGLNSVFRRYSFKPAAACAHLGLVALDLQRLRGELARRALFPEITAVQT